MHVQKKRGGSLFSDTNEDSGINEKETGVKKRKTKT